MFIFHGITPQRAVWSALVEMGGFEGGGGGAEPLALSVTCQASSQAKTFKRQCL